MALPVKVYLDTSKEINESTLTLGEYFLSSWRSWRSKRPGAIRKAEKAESEYIKALQMEREEFREYINILLDSQLVRGNLLLDNGIKSKPEEAELFIDRSKADILDLCIRSGDFIAYDIQEIEADPDLLICDPNLPIYLKVRNKLIDATPKNFK